MHVPAGSAVSKLVACRLQATQEMQGAIEQKIAWAQQASDQAQVARRAAEAKAEERKKSLKQDVCVSNLLATRCLLRCPV